MSVRRLLVRERRERERRRVQLAAAPAGPALEQLRPRGADDEQRNVRHPLDELVDEVEQALVRPVQVLDDEHERPLLGERLEEAAPGGEGLATSVAPELALAAEPDEGEEVRLDPGYVVRSVDASSTAPRIFSAATSLGGSCSWMPACALTISPSAQSVTPSPYARQRPCRQVMRSVGVVDPPRARRPAGSCRSRGRRRA